MVVQDAGVVSLGEADEELAAEALHPAASPAQALAASPPPPHIPGGVLPERLAAVCTGALSFKREDRFSTAHDLKLEVAHWLEQAADGTSKPGGEMGWDVKSNVKA